MITQMRKLAMFVACILTLGGASFSQQTSAPPDRTQSEAAIRHAVYEFSLATLTGNGDVFVEHAAKRTLDLYELIYLGMNDKVRKGLEQNGVRSSKDFLKFSFKQAGAAMASTPRPKLEESARANSNSPLSFRSDTEAFLDTAGGRLRAVWEDQKWKVDGADGMKVMFLKNLPLSDESRKKIEAL